MPARGVSGAGFDFTNYDTDPRAPPAYRDLPNNKRNGVSLDPARLKNVVVAGHEAIVVGLYSFVAAPASPRAEGVGDG